MRKSTKTKIMVLFVILILFSSSLAFIVIGAYDFGSTQENNEQVLNSSVIKGEIDQQTEAAYIQNGYTFLKYEYTAQSTIMAYIESLPQLFKTSDGTNQLFVIEIQSDKDSITVTSYKNTITVDNLTESSILSALCETVYVKPADCIIGSIFNTTI